ncbi:MAG: exopolysaccharide biosynthesis protein [Pseudomonadota bacterium]|nr:exopolysaccharide biosynthesis protein [Pseudomonadota bacterium]
MVDRHGEAGTRSLLDVFSQGNPDDVLKFGDVFAGLGKRSFGMLLFLSTLPAFFPIPGVGGAIAGPLVAMIGIQLLVGFRKPWLPRFVAERGPRRRAMTGFRDRISPWLVRLERTVRPRAAALLDHRLASALTGLLVMLLGVLLLLPIPFTNFLFGALLLLYALALLERDGLLMALAWVAGAIAVTVFGVLSGSLATAAARWVDLLI